jgi:hypothetical protein
MNPDDWEPEGKLPNGGLRIRHLPTRCIFEVWQQGRDVQALLRQGAAGTQRFEEAKVWFERFGRRQPNLL